MIATNLLSEVKQSYSFNAYKDLASELAAAGKCTGEQNPERIEAGKINAQRLQRIHKTCDIIPALQNKLDALKNKLIWLVLVETWCGDGAQCLPVIAKMSEACNNIDLKIILRDEHPSIMDAFLTNGSRSIPKLICINAESLEVIGTWGPRPKAIQEMVLAFKKENPNVSHDEFVKNLHLWYARDKTFSIQSEFIELLGLWNP